jgi:hypothetical protein
MHHRQQEQPQNAHHDVAFASIDLFVDTRAALFSAFGRLDALAGNNGGTGPGLSPGLLPDRRDRGRVEPLPQPAAAPAPVMPADCLPRRKVVGQQSPRLPTAHELEDRIGDLAVGPEARAAARPCRPRQQRGKAAPLVIIEVGWVRTSGMSFRPPRLAASFSKRSLIRTAADYSSF